MTHIQDKAALKVIALDAAYASRAARDALADAVCEHCKADSIFCVTCYLEIACRDCTDKAPRNVL